MIKHIFTALILSILFILLNCYRIDIQQEPEIVAVIPDKYKCLPGETIRINVTAIDLNGDNITVKWMSTKGTLVNNSGMTNSWRAPGETGPVTIIIFVNDGFHDKGVKYELSLEVTAEVLGANLTFVSEEGGTVMPGDIRNIPYSTPFYIYAISDEGYSFTGWSIEAGEHVIIAAPTEPFTYITLSQGIAAVKAHFELKNTPEPPKFNTYGATGSCIKLYDFSVYGSSSGVLDILPQLSFSATRGNVVGSSFFQMVSSSHVNWHYFGGVPKAIIYNEGNANPVFYAKPGLDGYVWVEFTGQPLFH